EHVNAPHLPLAALAGASRRRVQVSWQSTRREGYLLFQAPEELTAERLEAMEGDLATTEADFVFLIAPPGVPCRMPASASIPLEQVTERAAAAVLEHRYPGHMAIAPHTTAFLREREQELIDGFFRPAEMDVTQPGARALQVLVEGYLRPLGITKKSGTKILL